MCVRVRADMIVWLLYRIEHVVLNERGSNTYAHTPTKTQAQTHTRTRETVFIHQGICTRVNICTKYSRAFKHIYTHIHARVRAHTHIHTHTHAHTRAHTHAGACAHCKYMHSWQHIMAHTQMGGGMFAACRMHSVLLHWCRLRCAAHGRRCVCVHVHVCVLVSVHILYILCMCSICAYTHVFYLGWVCENSSCRAFARCVWVVSVARSVRAAALGFVRHICGNKLCHVAIHSARRVLFQLSSICVLAMVKICEPHCFQSICLHSRWMSQHMHTCTHTAHTLTLQSARSMQPLYLHNIHRLLHTYVRCRARNAIVLYTYYK